MFSDILIAGCRFEVGGWEQLFSSHITLKAPEGLNRLIGTAASHVGQCHVNHTWTRNFPEGLGGELGPGGYEGRAYAGIEMAVQRWRYRDGGTGMDSYIWMVVQGCGTEGGNMRMCGTIVWGNMCDVMWHLSLQISGDVTLTARSTKSTNLIG